MGGCPSIFYSDCTVTICKMQTKTGNVHSRTVNILIIPNKSPRCNTYIEHPTDLPMFWESLWESFFADLSLEIFLFHLIEEVALHVVLVIVLNQIIRDSLQGLDEIAFPLV